MSVRVAVIGTGWWATRAHLPALMADPEAEVVALVDPDPENLHRAADRFDVTATFGALTPGSTSTLTMATTIQPDDADPATALSSGALSTWNRTDGEAGLVVFAGSPGTTWTVTNGTVRFTHEGRLAP